MSQNDNPSNSISVQMSSASQLLPDDYNPEGVNTFDPNLDGDEAEANVDANRVLADHIAALMEMCHVFTAVYDGTTITSCTICLPNGHPLATEISVCNDPNLFRPEVGAAIAEKRARIKAENKLWELEGYRMMTILQADAVSRMMSED